MDLDGYCGRLDPVQRNTPAVAWKFLESQIHLFISHYAVFKTFYDLRLVFNRHQAYR